MNTSVRRHLRRKKYGGYGVVTKHKRYYLQSLPGKTIVRSSDALSYAERHRLPTREFAEPENRKYPIEDEIHARNALARVSQFGTEAEKREVRAAVHKKYPNIGRGVRK